MPIGKVWVFAEADEGKASTASLELLTKARELGDTVEAVLVDSGADAIAPQLGEHGAAKVYVADPGTSLTGVVGGAALLTGLIIGDDAGTVIAVSGALVGLYGLYEYLQ